MLWIISREHSLEGKRYKRVIYIACFEKNFIDVSRISTDTIGYKWTGVTLSLFQSKVEESVPGGSQVITNKSQKFMVWELKEWKTYMGPTSSMSFWLYLEWL